MCPASGTWPVRSTFNGCSAQALALFRFAFHVLVSSGTEWEKGSSRLIPGLVLTAENGN